VRVVNNTIGLSIGAAYHGSTSGLARKCKLADDPLQFVSLFPLPGATDKVRDRSCQSSLQPRHVARFTIARCAQAL
jgi:hypothetical protein